MLRSAQLSHFRATAQFLPWSATFVQLCLISGCFGADNVPFWANLGANWTSDYSESSFPKYVAVYPKIATFLPSYFFHSRCHWARVAILMTLQRSLQYSLSLSWTKALFPKIANFCTSLAYIIMIDVLLFVAKICQSIKGPKYYFTSKNEPNCTQFQCNIS